LVVTFASQMTSESIMKLLKFDKKTVLISIRKIKNYISDSISITIKNAIDQHKINLGSTLILSGISVRLPYGAISMEC